MNKLFNFLMLLCVFGFVSVRLSESAKAAPIAGKIGVGTWDTQAEFADVKVVQGAATLYQSDFATDMKGWTTLGGTWATSGGFLRQTGNGTPALALVGDTSWSNYTLTLKARKISGSEGFLISFGSTGDSTPSWWNLGGYGNTRHLLTAPGLSTSDVDGSIETGVWYDIKIELSGINVRCYLNGKLVHDATRLLDANERSDRFNELINSPGFGLLNTIEQNGLRDLAGRNVWIGDAARATFDAVPGNSAYEALTPAQQALIIRKVNRNRMTWNRGWGYDGLTWRDGYITANMDAAVMRYNSLGVFDKHLMANNSPGTPTADGGYDGQLRFGTQMTVRACIHEINHALGVGTYWRWGQNMVNGAWTGQYGNQQLAEFDGAGAVIQAGDAYHFRNYGMLYDQDYSWENARRSILLVAAMRRDMFLADQLNFAYDTTIPSGTYALVPRCAPGSMLDVLGSNPDAAAPLGINAYKGGSNPGDLSQKFLIDALPEGTYRIRTSLTGNRAVELPGGNTDNGSRVQLWNDNGLAPQRWFIIPTDSGWFKIAPLNNNFKGMDVSGASVADGTAVQSYDYLDNFAQQWKLVPINASGTTNLADGVYRLTPRHAPNSALDVLGLNAANGDSLGINTFASALSQKFQIDAQTDGTYRIRTDLAGNRAVDLPDGKTANGTKMRLWDDNGQANQRWHFIPLEDGWYKIAPKNDLTKSLDVDGVSTANGSLAQIWDYLAGQNQQWRLTPFSVVPPKVSIAGVSVTEGNQGTQAARFTVALSAASTQTVTVQFTTANGSAMAVSDYLATSGTLTFAPGEKSKTIEVLIVGDTAIESDETFKVQLTQVSNATLSVTEATGTILNDDSPSLSITDTKITEGNSGQNNASFTVKLNAAGLKAVTVNYATADDTATSGVDYISSKGSLNFAVGETSKTISVPVKGDLVVEPDETFFVNLSDATNATLGDAQGVGTISNDDSPTLNISAATVQEGNSSTSKATFNVTLSAPSSQTVTVQYATADDSAKAGSDYLAGRGQLTFAPGTTIQTVTVSILGDITAEINEIFFVNLSTAINATLSVERGVGTIIDDDEKIAPKLTISSPLNQSWLTSLPTISGTITDNEGGSGAAAVEFILKRGSDGLFWNGQTWGNSTVALTTVLTSGTWKNAGALPTPIAADMARKLSDGTYFISAKGTDKAGNSGKVESQFDVDNTLPREVTITVPTHGTAITSLPMISVNAIDGAGGSEISKVDLTLKRNSDGAYWNGDTWDGTKPVTLQTSLMAGSWQRRSKLPLVTATDLSKKLGDGIYTIAATAFDKAGNSNSVSNVFTVDTVAPSLLAITTPKDRSQISALPNVSGTISDNAGGSGIVRVEFSLRRNSDGVFWTGKAWYGQANINLPTTIQGGTWKNAGSLPIAPNYAYTEAMLDGSYTIRAVTVDRAGNGKAVESKFTFLHKGSSIRVSELQVDSQQSG